MGKTEPHKPKKRKRRAIIKYSAKTMIKEKDKTYYLSNSSSSGSEDEMERTKSLDFQEHNTVGLSLSEVNFSCKQKELFDEQLRMYVQLTTQAYLLSLGSLKFSALTLDSKRNLLELNKCATKDGTKSCFQSINLLEAVTIVDYFGGVYSTPDLEPPIEAKQVLCESKVFMYPELYPFSFFTKLYRVAVPICDPELNLMAMGLETFSEYDETTKLPLIRECYLPWLSINKFKLSISEARKSTEENPVTLFEKDSVLPVYPIPTTPFNASSIKAPVHHPLSDLPKWMAPFVDSYKRQGPSAPCLLLQKNKLSSVENELPTEPYCRSAHKSLRATTLKTHDHEMNNRYPKANVKYGTFSINSEINLNQDTCDPDNITMTDFDIPSDMDLSLSSGIKLSALKKSSVTNNFNKRSIKQEIGFKVDKT